MMFWIVDDMGPFIKEVIVNFFLNHVKKHIGYISFKRVVIYTNWYIRFTIAWMELPILYYI